jgi:hypothetical protein
MAMVGRIKRIILGGMVGGALVASVLLGSAARQQVSVAAHAVQAPIADNCPGVAGPC